MPFYELNLLLKPLPKKDIVACLKRAANLIWNNDGVLRRIEFLGLKQLPFKARGSEEGIRFNEGNYFIYHISIPNNTTINLKPEFKLDNDVLRMAMYEANESRVPGDYECTLEEELLSPFFRPSVQPLITDKNVLTKPRRVHNINKKRVKLIG